MKDGLFDNVIKYRGSLERFKAALNTDKAVIGFIGGSITEAVQESNWWEFIRGWFVKKYPGIKLFIENAAVGGTGSLSGVMRARSDIIEKNCDLVFIEYAVNDYCVDREERMRSREGLIRQLIEEKRDIILVYTYCQQMYNAMKKGDIPDSVADFEILADKYNISSVWSGLYAYNAVKEGRLSWEGWLPISGGGLHPEYLGSKYYAEPVIECLEKSLIKDGAQIPYGKDMPEPYNINHYQNIKAVDFAEIKLTGPWCVMNEVFIPWYKRVLYSSADGAGISFDFSGTAIMGMFSFGKRSALIKFRIDNGEWNELTGNRDWWVPDKNWCTPQLFASNLENKKHLFEMTIEHGDRPEFKGTECKIFSFMYVK